MCIVLQMFADLFSSLPKSLILKDNSALHHKTDVPHDRNIFKRIPGDGDDIGEITGFEGADLTLPSEEFGAVQQIGLQHS